MKDYDLGSERGERGPGRYEREPVATPKRCMPRYCQIVPLNGTFPMSSYVRKVTRIRP